MTWIHNKVKDIVSMKADFIRRFKEQLERNENRPRSVENTKALKDGDESVAAK